MKLSKKDFLSLRDFSREELDEILRVAAAQKPLARSFRLPPSHPGRVLACIFHKPSLRTRLSFEVAIRQLGGSSLFVTDKEIGIESREAPKDVGQVLSRYVDAIMIRTFKQSLVEELARNASVPVVNGLTDLLHPCQVLGDIMTVVERRGSIEGARVVFIGDGNNVARSWLNAAARFPFTFVLAAPKGYEIEEEFVAGAKRDGSPAYEVVHDPREAVRGADVVYTDVWASMGQETEKERRAKAFASFQVNDRLMKLAKPSAIFMHCLPAHRGDEVTDSVIDGPQSAVYDEAENRLHIQRAILSLLVPGEGTA
ncbi:MAG: ornithine carbamoyltransferase [Candidatus Latescibacterota bacterium]|jgi:ornithine carbamoyltransferase|nr:MAG: ornithine carbamoyltransferase [Candidatus Latescibacterota bacterium]